MIISNYDSLYYERHVAYIQNKKVSFYLQNKDYYSISILIMGVVYYKTLLKIIIPPFFIIISYFKKKITTI